MRSALILSCLIAGACGFDAPDIDEPGDDGGGGGGGGGGGPDCTTFSEQLDTCALPTAIPLTLSGVLSFDTDLGVLRDSNNAEIAVSSVPVMTRGAEVRVLVATSVELQPNTILRAVGTRGFAIVASEAINLLPDAVIDVSQGGAGHRGDCGPTGASVGVDDNDGAGGGGGGGLGAPGGAGGNGDSDQNQSAGGRPGAAESRLPAGPLGGCPGAAGGKGDHPDNTGGAGGRGGGAVYLVSARSIAIASGAGIHTGGDGGGGGERRTGSGDAGGGGGGSGGSIFLEAPVIRSEGILAANGGGGGEGSGGNFAGRPGSPGPFGIDQAAGGMNGANTGADGGAGGHLANPAGVKPPLVLAGGGGGGGGGVGVIRVRSPNARLGTLVSPEPQP